MTHRGDWMLLFNILETAMVISGRVSTCDSTLHWEIRLLVFQSHYPDTVQTSPCPILLVRSTGQSSDKYELL